MLRVLGRGDLAALPVSPAEALALVADGLRRAATGRSMTGTTTALPPDGDGHPAPYALLGRDTALARTGFRTSYRSGSRRTTTLLLHDDTGAAPAVLLDAERVGTLRTAATCALTARELAAPGARSVLLIGSGAQARHVLPLLLAALPGLDRLLLAATHPVGIAAVRARLAADHPGRGVDLVTDVRGAVAEADVVVAAAGPGTRTAVEADRLRPGALAVRIGHGLAPSVWRTADRVVATSTAGLLALAAATGVPREYLPAVDAELPDVLLGRTPGRTGPAERICAFVTGLVAADIALGHHLAALAAERGLGTDVPLEEEEE
ncbi:ornithine cyclodeaminase/mu-crystallin [Actinobacteria bacterium OK074]|nr:ornithine cyclodeaminase/mu-crystallin [Actinobacteria bacterium OK074]